MPRYVDSLDKIVESYFAAIAAKPFTYAGRTYAPKPLVVSPLIFRHYTCPAKCGACCPRFSLVYLPEAAEAHPYGLARRVVAFDGHPVTVFEDAQSDHDRYHCRNLDMASGRCGIHGRQPFSCDFELLRVLHHETYNVLIQKLYGRKWNMLRVDGVRGARCEMIAQDRAALSDLLRRLGRLVRWAEHFGLPHKLAKVMSWVAVGPHSEPLTV